MTVQKKILDLTGSQYLVQKVKSAINDVDSSLSTHTSDTDIHVTTADKTKWNNQTYVFRYSSTALVASSTNSNALLDNTDNLKVGDKVIDSSGVLFSITAIDTANSTFTIGTSLIDLAQDSDVVHKSGNETIAGQKTFGDQTLVYNPDNTANTPNIILKNSRFSRGSTTELDTQYIRFTDKSSKNCGQLSCYGNSAGNTLISLFASNTDSNNQTINSYVTLAKASSGDSSFYPNNDNETTLGTSSKKWSKIYGTEYYYGSSKVEFSTKFVTTDTAQTISGAKIFSDSPLIYNSDSSASIPQISLKNQKVVKSSTTETGAQLIYFVDKNNQGLGQIEVRVVSNGATGLNFTAYGLDSNNQNISSGVQILRSPTTANFAPNADNAVTCGRALAKWSDVVTYKVNGLTPSSLSLPDLSNGIDISSYLNTGSSTNDSYTASVNGYISIIFSSSTACGCYVYNYTDGVFQRSNSITDSTYTNVCGCFIPILKNQTLNISTRATESIVSAKFFPCQGNV